MNTGTLAEINAKPKKDNSRVGTKSEMKEWEILSDEEADFVWQTIRERFEFNSRDNLSPFLKLPEPYQIYDIHLFTSYLKDKSITIDDEYYNTFNRYITDVFIKCMGSDEYIYALDWQHTSFKYNPNSPEIMPRVTHMEEFNVYFPDFYPDGDYYFFIASNFSWGYFTHPWTQELWIFGEELIAEIVKVPQIYLTRKFSQ
ncbi:MAG: DUF2716 domain-containing protein [Paenibacillus sp.]|nr:DUF2716 domain-containing protein [Paenibacillus sp.]